MWDYKKNRNQIKFNKFNKLPMQQMLKVHHEASIFKNMRNQIVKYKIQINFMKIESHMLVITPTHNEKKHKKIICFAKVMNI